MLRISGQKGLRKPATCVIMNESATPRPPTMFDGGAASGGVLNSNPWGRETLIMRKRECIDARRWHTGGAGFFVPVAALACGLDPGTAGGRGAALADSVGAAFSDHRTVEIQANTFTGSEQSNPTVAIGRDGRVVVAWDSRRQELGSYGVFAQVFDALGRPLGGEVHVNETLRGMQDHAALAASPFDGTYWCTWESTGQDGSGESIVARRFGADLTPLGGEIAVNVTREGHQASPSIATGADGGALIAWTGVESSELFGAERQRVFARLFDSDGRPVGGEIRFGGAHADRDAQGVAAPAAGGGYLVAWARTDERGDSAGLFVQRVDYTGTCIGEPIRLNEDDGQEHIEPVVAADPHGGGFVAAWHVGAAAGYDVCVRRFDAAGEPREATRRIAHASSGWKSGVAVAVAADGRCVVTYNSDGAAGDGDGEGIVAHVFDATGNAVGSPFVVNRQGAGRQGLTIASTAQRVAWSDRDQLAVAWSGLSAEGDSSSSSLTLFAPADLDVPAPDATQERLAATFTQAEWDAPIPPLWDPNYVPQDPLVGIAGDGPDFGFEGVPGTGWYPPDPHLSVGPDHVVVMTNGQIAFFTKEGLNTFRDEIEDSFGFWGQQGATNFVFDPETIYDPHTGRFMAMACERAPSRSYFLLAVSDDSDPNGTWHKYRLDVTSFVGSDIDSPNLAVDASNIYLTSDHFGPDKYMVLIVDKASVLNGGTPVRTEEVIRNNIHSYGLPMTYDTDAPAQYMLQSTEQTNNTTVIFHAIRDPFTNYSRVTHTLNVQPYTYPNQPPQRGTSSRPFLFEPRFWSCVYRNGSLWATHHVNSTRARVRWYEFSMNGWPESGQNPTVRQWGEIDLGGGIHTYFGSIDVDDEGNAALTFARSASDEYISMSRAVRAADDPLGTFQPAVFVKESTGYATGGRWGDYSGTQHDPVRPGSFWGHHEFTTTNGTAWRTWIARYDLADFDLTVSGVCPGQITVSWDGAPANATLGLLFAAGPGDAVIPNGQPCAGTQLGLSPAQLQLVATFPSGDSGGGNRQGNAPGAACGASLQLIAAGSCETSNVTQIP